MEFMLHYIYIFTGSMLWAFYYECYIRYNLKFNLFIHCRNGYTILICASKIALQLMLTVEVLLKRLVYVFCKVLCLTQFGPYFLVG